MCRFNCERVALWAPTSPLLAWFWMNLKPGMRFWVHTTPTSSECLQSDTPKPLDWHWARLFSPPVQCTLSSQIWPGMESGKVGGKLIYVVLHIKISAEDPLRSLFSLWLVWFWLDEVAEHAAFNWLYSAYTGICFCSFSAWLVLYFSVVQCTI